MDRKLPKVFANSFDRELNNNSKVYYSSQDRSTEVKENKKEIIGTTVDQKLNSIFNSVNFIYKADVVLTLDSGKVFKRVIGRNRANLITMDNEIIPIKSIIDVEYSE